MNHGKTDKNIESRLQSERSVIVLSALDEIKTKGNISYLPLMFDLLKSQPDLEIEKEIKNILGSLKVEEATSVIAEALQSDQYRPIRKDLITACWQNGLDYKEHLPVFVDMIIEEEWETGFEAFTVIENLKVLPKQDVIDECVIKIKNSLSEASDKKRYFLEEILALIC